MIAVTPRQLWGIAPYLDPKTCVSYAEAFTMALPDGEIDTPRRLRHFMAQIAKESGGFRQLQENLHYTNPEHLREVFPREIPDHIEAAFLIHSGPAAIANRVYANRGGNGNEASGDGYKYRGRGWIQLTFRDNYRQIGSEIGMDLIDNPDLLEEPDTAAQAAAKYWLHFGCNTYADRDDIVGVTRIINSAMEGLDDRKLWLAKCSVMWPDDKNINRPTQPC